MCTHRLKASLSNILMPPYHGAAHSRGWCDNINVGLNKVFSCGLVTSLNCQIPLGFKHSQHLDTPDYSYDYITHGGKYTVTLSLSYTFGKSQVRVAGEKASAIKL